MSTWVRCEDGGWINLAMCDWIYLAYEADKWAIFASFTSGNSIDREIGSYTTQKRAQDVLDTLMLSWKKL